MELRIDKIFAAFSFPILQKGKAICELLEENKISLRDFISFVETLQKAKSSSVWFPKCPNCGKPIGIAPVNSNARDQIGGDYKSVLTCSNWKDCGYERYSEKTIQEELELLRRKSNGTR